MRWGLGLLLFVFVSDAYSQIKLFDEPLKPLAVTITSNFKLINTKGQTGAEIGRTDLGQGMIEPEYFRSPGTLTYVSTAGQTVKLDVEVEPRGMRRRQYCEYKPLDVRFKNKPKDELFKNASKSIEMITHCVKEEYLYAVYNEYFSYRIKSAFNAPSFRVRMANVTYVDTTGTFATVTFPAVFLESKKDMAERMGGSPLKLTEAEEAVPLTQNELNEASWASHYGDSYVTKIALRLRLYNKYLNLYRKVPLTLREIFLEKLAKAMVINYDVAQNLLVNIFPIQFNSGAVQMVEYDFDEAALGSYEGSKILPEIFKAYAEEQGLRLDQYKATKTKAQKDADKQTTLLVIQEAIKAYESSGLEQEMKNFNSPFFNVNWHLKALKEAIKDLETTLADPDKAFAFLN